jgi:phosphate uptake regulator
MSAAIDVWAGKDEEAAAGLQQHDDVVDDLHGRLIAQLLLLRDETAIPSAIRLATIGRYLERIADHAVNIGELVSYYVNGDEERSTSARRPAAHASRRSFARAVSRSQVVLYTPPIFSGGSFTGAASPG